MTGIESLQEDLVERLGDIGGADALAISEDFAELLRKRGASVTEAFTAEEIAALGRKFDIVAGYGEHAGGKGTPPWARVAVAALEAAKENGRVAMMHPSAWRDYTKTNNKFVPRIGFIINGMNMLYLRLSAFNHEKNDRVSIPFDMYIAANRNNPDHATEIHAADGGTHFRNVKIMPFIPNCFDDKFEKLLTKSEGDRVVLAWQNNGDDHYEHKISIGPRGDGGKTHIVSNHGNDENGISLILDSREEKEQTLQILEDREFHDYFERMAKIDTRKFNIKAFRLFKRNWWKIYLGMETAESEYVAEDPLVAQKERSHASRMVTGWDRDPKFRENAIRHWNGKCSVRSPVPDGANAKRLDAAHIKPDNMCDGTECRNPHNSLLLDKNMHYAFDSGWISWRDDGYVMRMETEIPNLLTYGIDADTRLIQEVIDDTETMKFIAWHREIIFKG